MFVLVYLLSVIIAKCVYTTFSFTETALQCFICRAVMESISPKHCMSEDKARHHFVDLILGSASGAVKAGVPADLLSCTSLASVVHCSDTPKSAICR